MAERRQTQTVLCKYRTSICFSNYSVPNIHLSRFFLKARKGKVFGHFINFILQEKIVQSYLFVL